MHDHDRGDQRPTDRRIDTSDEPDHNQDQVWFECACCGTRYRSRRTAMQCCAECFDDPDHDPRSPPVAMTDGGRPVPGRETPRRPPTGPLWVVTCTMSALIIVGSLIAYDLPTARAYGVLGGVTLPLLAALHFVAGRR
jgi:hypothetical protein